MFEDHAFELRDGNHSPSGVLGYKGLERLDHGQKFAAGSLTTLRSPGSAGTNYPFLTLKERDIETGLDYFLARYYSSTQGRFTSPDEFTGGPDELYYFADDASANPTFYADVATNEFLMMLE